MLIFTYNLLKKLIVLRSPNESVSINYNSRATHYSNSVQKLKKVVRHIYLNLNLILNSLSDIEKQTAMLR